MRDLSRTNRWLYALLVLYISLLRPVESAASAKWSLSSTAANLRPLVHYPIRRWTDRSTPTTSRGSSAKYAALPNNNLNFITQLPRGGSMAKGSNDSQPVGKSKTKGKATRSSRRQNPAGSVRQQKSRNTTRPKSNKRRNSSTKADIFQLKPISSEASSSLSTQIQVKALLTRRVFGRKTIGRLFFGALAVFFFQQCLKTAGIPHRQAIWNILQQKNIFEAGSLTIMPTTYQPSPLDSFLAHQLATAANDIIPPEAMPLSTPFLGALFSILSYILFTVLLPHWFLRIRVWCDYEYFHGTNKDGVPDAALVQLSTLHQGGGQRNDLLICDLQTTNTQAQMLHGMPSYYFEYNNMRYYYDLDTNTCWDAGPNLQLSVAELVQSSTNTKHKTLHKTTHVGLLNTPSKLLQAEERWHAYNHQTSLKIPSMIQALRQRLKSPLVCIQLIGQTLTVLDEGKQAMVNLGSTVLNHFQNARVSILASRTLQQDIAGLASESATTSIWIYRLGHWKQLTAADLLPGDVFLLSAPSQHQQQQASANKDARKDAPKPHSRDVTIPVDALLLDGSCVTMEASLTGETVPQTKLPVDSSAPAWNQTLDMSGVHRHATLFAGTSLLHCVPPPPMPTSFKKKTKSSGDGPPPGILCLAVRTGSYSTKGELLQALTLSQAKSGAAIVTNPQFDKDALKLISVMSVVGALGCGSLFWGVPAGGRKVSSFRRVIQCTRIITAVIPSDLPLYLSSVVQTCVQGLRKNADVVCSQPGALLTAAQVDTCVFDKTGTLTADTQALSKVVGLTGTKTKAEKKIKSKSNTNSLKKEGAQYLNLEQELVLAGCHSLVDITDDKNATEVKLVGDPLELAALQCSRWKFVPEGRCYCPCVVRDAADSVEKLWQLRVFPFDPTLRLSSALCLTCHKDGRYRLWKLVKGSPDRLKPLLDSSLSTNFTEQFDERVESLEEKGFRTIAMGMLELTDSSSGFAKAILNAMTAWNIDEADMIERARGIAASSDVHRRDLEQETRGPNLAGNMTGPAMGLFKFSGFACYTASIRPASKRVIGELQKGSISTIMLTGDSLSAAIFVAAKVGILGKGTEIAILETPSEFDPGRPKLRWRLQTSSTKKDKQATVTSLDATSKTTKEILKLVKQGQCQLVMSGAAFAALRSMGSKSWCKILVNSIPLVSVVARASPQVKEEFVSLMKISGGRRVLMCGDGVNDCAAMKEAELSVALMNGYGMELSGGKDLDDERRRQRLHAKRQKKAGSASSFQEESVAMRVSSRLQEKGAANNVKDIWNIVLEEQRRAAKIKKGGVDAARILAADHDDNLEENTDVKPGEASLASPFSCLRQSIDGLEWVLRTGIATAALSISMEQKIALTSLITCFNLSALFRDDVRYGNKMWAAEYLLAMIIEQASFLHAVKPRPRLPRRKRPSAQSLFDAPNVASVAAQTMIHLLSVQTSMWFARRWELRSKDTVDSKPGKMLIRASAKETKTALLLNSLAQNVYSGSTSRDDRTGSSGFGRKKFVPNFETNAVFVLSIFQNTLTSLLFHKGRPFYLSILESKRLCQISCMSILFATCCILDSRPSLNNWLQLKPWDNRRQRMTILAIVVFDSLACILTELLCRQVFDRSMEVEQKKTPEQAGGHAKSRINSSLTAAEEEDLALAEEAKKNLWFLMNVSSVLVLLVLIAAMRS